MKAYLGLVNSYHALAMISLLAYMSYLWQAPAVFVVLSLTARVERLQDFAVSLIVSLTITIAIFAFFPALGWYEYLRLDLSAFTNILSFRTSCLMSRSCAAELFTPFRSTASAALSASRAIMRPWQCWRFWALWPIRIIRWPLLLLNALMVASTPIEGIHYAVTSSAASLSAVSSALLIVVWTRQAIYTPSCADARVRAVVENPASPATANLA